MARRLRCPPTSRASPSTGSWRNRRREPPFLEQQAAERVSASPLWPDTLGARFDVARRGPPMSYAQSVLQPGETIVATGRLHWIIYDWAILSLVAGAALLILEFRYLPDHHGLTAGTAILFGALFVLFFAYFWFIRWITEFAVTNRRVIFKRGFVWRATEEMNMDKVETVDVGQSIPGRVFD